MCALRQEILKPYQNCDLFPTQNLIFQIMTVIARNNTNVIYDCMGEKGQPDAKSVGRKKETDDHQFAHILLFNNSQNFGFFENARSHEKHLLHFSYFI